MKGIQLHKTFLFFLMLFGSIYTYASDTLKVKKVRFYIEPKAAFIIPKYSQGAYSNFVENSVFEEIPTTPYNDVYSWQNKNTINYNISSGISSRLNKYFNYEFSLGYYHYSLKNKVTETATDLSGNYLFGGTTNYNIKFGALVIGNGLAFRYKKFVFTNSFMLYFMSHPSSYNLGNKYSSHDENSQLFQFMSEHKIGYSLFKTRIEMYVGINVLYSFTFGYPFVYPVYVYNQMQTYSAQNSVMPFTSLRINF